MEKLFQLLMQAAQKNPDLVIDIAQLILNLLKANPELLKKLLEMIFQKNEQ